MIEGRVTDRIYKNINVITVIMQVRINLTNWNPKQAPEGGGTAILRTANHPHRPHAYLQKISEVEGQRSFGPPITPVAPTAGLEEPPEPTDRGWVDAPQIRETIVPHGPHGRLKKPPEPTNRGWVDAPQMRETIAPHGPRDHLNKPPDPINTA